MLKLSRPRYDDGCFEMQVLRGNRIPVETPQPPATVAK